MYSTPSEVFHLTVLHRVFYLSIVKGESRSLSLTHLAKWSAKQVLLSEPALDFNTCLQIYAGTSVL